MLMGVRGGLLGLAMPEFKNMSWLVGRAEYEALVSIMRAGAR